MNMATNGLKELVQKTSQQSIQRGVEFTKPMRARETMVRRSRIERCLDILKVVARFGPIKQTHIMYKANLSWTELKRDIENLKRLKMITEIDEDGNLLYAISESGLSTIYNYEKIEEIFSEKGERLNSRWSF